MSVRTEYLEDLKKRIADSKTRLEEAKDKVGAGFVFPDLMKGYKEISKDIKTVGYIAVALVGGIVVIKVIGLMD